MAEYADPFFSQEPPLLRMLREREKRAIDEMIRLLETDMNRPPSGSDDAVLTDID